MKALISGISGQDGKHLTKLLLSKGYEVFGLTRDPRVTLQDDFFSVLPELNLFEANLNDYDSIYSVLNKIKPNEIYNLASMSYVVDSIATPLKSAEVNALGPLKLLQSVVDLDLIDHTKVYQASSSEMFGSVNQSPQNELTPYFPVTPYGIAKVFAHYTCRNYRDAHGLFAASGILYNHEGEYRHPNFVSRKISQSIARIALGKQTTMTLGNIDARRDWGYAGDYVEAMWLMLQAEVAEDYVIATGFTHTVREFLEKAFQVIGIDDGINKFVQIDPHLVRKFDVNTLVGDPAKAKEKLGWEPKVSFDDLVQIMVNNDLKIEGKR